MNAEYINPFLQSTLTFFRDYLSMEIENYKPYLEREPDNISDVSALIGLAGEVKGTIVLNFSRNTAIEIGTLFAGVRYRALSRDLVDAVGEMVNIIAGNAKQYLDQRIEISLPGVIIGEKYKFRWERGVPVIAIPFMTRYGGLRVLVSIKGSGRPAAGKDARS